MLYTFYGTDIRKSVEKAHALVHSLRTKRPDAAFVHADADNWYPALIEEHLGGQGLFSNKYIIFLDRLMQNKEVEEVLGEWLAPMKESDNIFIILEGKLLTDMKKSVEKHAEKSVVSDISESAKAAKRDDFNIFALADAVGSRDAVKAWSIYRQAVDGGIEAENIAGTLFWQAKSMALAVETSSASVAGLSPFVFTKSKRYAGNYSKRELAGLISDIITLYHDGHRGKRDLELALEKLVLNCGTPKM